MKKAVIIAFDEFTDIDVFITWDLLNRVKFRDADFDVKLVGTEKSHKSVCGIRLDMHDRIEACAEADLVFFTSGPGTRKLILEKAYLDRFSLDPQRQILCSMCSGALILAALGHLKNLSATTYPTAVELLRSFDVKVIEDSHLVTHGNIGTAAGCLAAVDLMSWAIEKLYDKEIAQDVIRSVLPVGRGLAGIS